MDIRREIKEEPNGEELLVCAWLAVAYTHLNMAPFDSWGHEGGPAEMAAFVVQASKKQGRFGMLSESMGVVGRMAR